MKFSQYLPPSLREKLTAIKTIFGGTQTNEAAIGQKPKTSTIQTEELKPDVIEEEIVEEPMSENSTSPIVPEAKPVEKKPRKILEDFSQDDERLMALKGIHAGQRAFLLGNGPSVRPDDLERLQDEVTFAANRFYLAYDQHNLKMRPTYTVCVDLLVLKNHGPGIVAKCQTPLFVSGRQPDLTEIEKFRTDNVITLREKAPPYNTENPDDFLFSADLTKEFGQGYSVIYAMMQLANWMGIKKMLLYGIDHNFILPKDYVKPGVQVTHQGEDNHFIANYRNVGEKWAPPNPPKTEAGYLAAKKFCELQGIEIYNCTRGGKLEIFKRQSFDVELANTA